MVETEEGWHTLPDGTELYTKSWKPSTSPSAVITFIHGFSDHCNRYADFFPNLASRGILVHSFDQRGWGRSVKKPSDKGLTGPTSQVLADITSFIQKHLPSPVPLFLMGHSMGGQETLQYAALGPKEVKGQISGFLAAAPYIRLHPSSEPNRLTVMVGKLAGKLLPKRQLVSALDSAYMCHDQEMCKSWEEDELCHDTGTLEGLAGMLARGDELDKGSVVIKDWEGCHIWLGHGADDRVTSVEATKAFVKRLNVKDKTLQLYEGCYHCIHLEPDGKQKFTTDVADWILARAKTDAPQSAGHTEAQSKL